MSTKETRILKEVQLAASERGWRLLRNNVGEGYTLQGNYIKYGLGVGTSDLIGWRGYVITSEDVGRTIAQFCAVEIKTPTGKPSKEQLAFISAVKDAGGIGIIARSDVDLDDGE